jgi:hypothetical protein
MRSIYVQHTNRINYLKLYLSDLEEIWECEWDSWVKEAINQGYKMIKMFSIWHYDEKETYDPDLKKGGLFTGYINKFLKMKTEASGFPSHVATEGQKRTYVTNYYLHEGV